MVALPHPPHLSPCQLFLLAPLFFFAFFPEIRLALGANGIDNLQGDVAGYDSVNKPSSVTYDERSLIIDGKRVLIFSGSIHYPRVPTAAWDKILRMAKRGGLNCIQTYVFWNVHEPAMVGTVATLSPQAETLIKSQNFGLRTGLLSTEVSYYGGTNYGRTSASFITTRYYDEAPIDEYGLLRFPKYGHLKDLHYALEMSKEALLEGVYSVETYSPRAFVKPRDNLIVIFDEEGGSVESVEILVVDRTQVCSFVSESYTPHVKSWKRDETGRIVAARGNPRTIARVTCPENHVATSVEFASFGRPWGICQLLKADERCHAKKTKRVVERYCLGKRSCMIPVMRKLFEEGDDPCPEEKDKVLAFQLKCTLERLM